MKGIHHIALLAGLVLLSCSDDDPEIFDKSADVRASEAISQLTQELVAPANGWLIQYRPEQSSGMYYVLLKFLDNGKLVISSDLGAEAGRYFKDTVSYRVDNSLGLELIIENYSFFSYLFEQEQATFGAEYEFNYINKTPDNELVFQSKTDLNSPKDLILFRPASANADVLLGIPVAGQLQRMAEDLNKVFPSFRLAFDDVDLAMYLTMDQLRRSLTINAASQKTNTANRQSINFTTTYYLQGDSLIFESPFSRTVLGNPVTLRSIRLIEEGEGALGACAAPLPSHNFTGVTSAGASVLLESTLLDVSGSSFAEQSDFYFCPLQYIFEDGFSANRRISQDIAGALEMHLYYGYDIGGPDLLYGLGFVIQNPDETVTFALREFTPTLIDNRIVFNFAADVSEFGSPTSPANLESVKHYTDELAADGQTYVFSLNQGVFEFHNPCSGWSLIFINAN